MEWYGVGYKMSYKCENCGEILEKLIDHREHKCKESEAKNEKK